MYPVARTVLNPRKEISRARDRTSNLRVSDLSTGARRSSGLKFLGNIRAPL